MATVESVRMQTCENREVVIVDGGSMDASRAILEENEAKHADMMIVVNKSNGGISSARNAGVEKANGDYHYFLDSDDFLKSHVNASIRQTVAVSENGDVIYLDCIVTYQGKRWSSHNQYVVPWFTLRNHFMFIGWEEKGHFLQN